MALDRFLEPEFDTGGAVGGNYIRRHRPAAPSILAPVGTAASRNTTGRRALALPDVSWHTDAACRGKDPALFVPSLGDYRIPADTTKALCNDCPVREPCLEFAIRYHEAGWWGGTSEKDRAKIRRSRQPSRQPRRPKASR